MILPLLEGFRGGGVHPTPLAPPVSGPPPHLTPCGPPPIIPPLSPPQENTNSNAAVSVKNPTFCLFSKLESINLCYLIWANKKKH